MIVLMDTSFVIHAHSGQGPVHYDLMLQAGDALATWRLACPAAELPLDSPTGVRRIQDHRLAYLDYQGPISNGRGCVTMVDRGFYEPISICEDCWQVRLASLQTQGRFELRRLGPGSDDWTITRLTAR